MPDHARDTQQYALYCSCRQKHKIEAVCTYTHIVSYNIVRREAASSEIYLVFPLLLLLGVVLVILRAPLGLPPPTLEVEELGGRECTSCLPIR